MMTMRALAIIALAQLVVGDPCSLLLPNRASPDVLRAELCFDRQAVAGNHILTAGSIRLCTAPEVFDNSAVVGGRLVGRAAQQLVMSMAPPCFVLRFGGLPAGTYQAFVELEYATFPMNGSFQEAHMLAPQSRPLLSASILIPHRQCGCRDFGAGYWQLPRVPEHLGTTWITSNSLGVETAASLVGARFHPHGCSIAAHKPRRLQLCVVGDSQARHLSGALSALQGGDAIEAAVSTVTDHAMHTGNGVRYWPSLFGPCQRQGSETGCWSDPEVLPTCEVVLLNFGQWPASGSSGLLPPDPPNAPPWSVERYEAAVTDVLTSALRTTARLLWLTVHPHGITERVLSAQDWRSSHVLQLYANASIRAATSLGVAYMDIHSMADVLRDLSYDGAHYAAPVEAEIARAVHACSMTLVG